MLALALVAVCALVGAGVGYAVFLNMRSEIVAQVVATTRRQDAQLFGGTWMPEINGRKPGPYVDYNIQHFRSTDEPRRRP